MPLRTLFRVLILSAIFLTISLYVDLNNKPEKILIKENNTSEMEPDLSAKPPVRTGNSVSEKPKEGLGLLIGQNVQALLKQLGEPDRIDESMYDYQWYIYNKDHAHYVQVGVENNQICTVFAMGDNLDVVPFEIGQPVEEIFNTQFIDTNINLELDGTSYRFELNDTDLNLRPIVQLGNLYVQLYIDRFTGNLSSVRFLDAKTLIKQRPYEMVYSGTLLKPLELSENMWQRIEEGSAREIFDITNVIRSRNNLEPLEWDEATAEVAALHSRDMAENDDFSHNSKKFGSLADRLKTAKVVYQTAGENIAANYTDGPAVVEGWINSKGHRDTLLNKEFTHLGVGVYRQYYTQNFIQKSKE